MILQQTLLALVLLNLQAGTQGQSLFPPKPQAPVVDDAFNSWHGWTYLNGAPGKLPAMYETAGDWSDIQAHYESLKPGKPAAWRMKVVIFTRIESDGRDALGVLRERRATIESVQLAQVRQALDRFNAEVLATFNGAVSIVPDIQIESEWMRDAGPNAFGAEFAKQYFEPRINGGTYEAEDKVFRGPFNSVIYILPGATAGPIPDMVVNDTPVAAVPANPLNSAGLSYSLDSVLGQTWLRQVQARCREQGYQSLSTTKAARQQACRHWGLRFESPPI